MPPASSGLAAFLFGWAASLLDWTGVLVSAIVGALPDVAAPYLWFPLFVVAAYLVLWLVVRFGVRWAGFLLEWLVLRLLITVLLWTALTLECFAAVTVRVLREGVPSAVYASGDAAAAAADWCYRKAGLVTSGCGRAARLHGGLVFLIFVVALLLWNGGQCGQFLPGACTAPAHEWWLAVSSNWTGG